MKRDMDLIRDLLLEIEGGRKSFIMLPKSHAAALGISEEDALEDEQAAALEYHLGLLEDAGFTEFRRTSGGYWYTETLSWSGHEFLDNIRPQDIWDKAKDGAEHMGGFSMEILGKLAQGFIKKKIELHTGIEL